MAFIFYQLLLPPGPLAPSSHKTRCTLEGHPNGQTRPLTFVEIVFGDSRAPMAKEWIQESQDILKELKDHLQRAQNQQKLYADRHRVERTFEVGDLVYLRLQPYRQASIKKNGTEKLKPLSMGLTG
jgi:flagellar basal body L-ring protein FlgH